MAETIDAYETLKREVAAFRKWATPDRQRYYEWEVEYPKWDALEQTFCAVLDANEADWPEEIADLLLYVLARNEEVTALRRELIARPRPLVALAEVGLTSEFRARHQLAYALGKAGDPEPSIALLERYVEDEDEYVGRVGLLSLAERGYPHTERLALRFWETDDEWQRISALWALAWTNSPRLAELLDMAEDDGREHLVVHSRRIRAGER